MKYFKYFLIPILFALFSFVFVTRTHAATDIDINPVEYINSTTFKIDVNTNESTTNGVTLILEIDGDVEIQSITEGTSALCGTFDAQQTETKISITCLENEDVSLNGTIAEINATVGNSYSITVVEDSSDLGGLSLGEVTNIVVAPVTDTNEDTATDDYLLLYTSGGIFFILLIVLIIVINRKKKQESELQ